MSDTSGVSFTLRSTARTPAMYQQRQDFTVVEDGRTIGRIREEPRARPQLRWFWMITVPGDQKLRIGRSGHAVTLAQAQTMFQSSWTRMRATAEN